MSMKIRSIIIAAVIAPVFSFAAPPQAPVKITKCEMAFYVDPKAPPDVLKVPEKERLKAKDENGKIYTYYYRCVTEDNGILNAVTEKAAKIVEEAGAANRNSTQKVNLYFNPRGNPNVPGSKLVAVPVLPLPQPRPAGRPMVRPPVKPSAPKPTFSTPSADWTPVLPKPKPAATVRPNEPKAVPFPEIDLSARAIEK